uniref:Receptor-like serine/threonine-protein kinase n=2 Tax=Cajanus cajan TaxID=3821 RepID=A0A151QZL4_CAJCA|nr:Putative serine/threonine-protein kinase receptor [Cajanus cajan]
MHDGKTLVSKGGKFELGFFSPGSSQKRYLGIWYKNIRIQTVVWVANRENPINDSSGILTVNSTGNLVLTQNESLVWYTNSHKQAQNPVVELLDSGNLVIRNEGDTDTEGYLWQSFDYPSDTLLPEMKLGSDLRTGLERKYIAWKSPDDPSPGDIFRVLKLYNYPEIYMMKGTQKLFRYGPWNGLCFSGIADLRNNSIYGFNFVRNKDEVYYTFSLVSDHVITRTVTNQSGSISRYVWAVGEDQDWKVYRSYPKEFCDTYSLCGPYGYCVSTQSQSCQCLKGFSPKSPERWNSSDWSQGCVRNKPLRCKDKLTEGFVKFKGLKVPDTTSTWLDESIGLEECRVKCLNNCSCMAFTNSDIRGGGSGCAMWFGELVDMKMYVIGGQDLYIRMDASELEPVHRHKKKMGTIVAATVAAICGVLILLSTYFVCGIRRNNAGNSLSEVYNEKHMDDLDIQLFDLLTIATATNDFSTKNKIGEGGFGPVYKGILTNGQEIAVKTLSRSSWQGVTEFINEVKLIAKLQHRSLVKLLGCCIQEQEKMLIYEYMANGSLDSFIFDDRKSKLLQWPERFHIICGIARGLMYLHQDSRLRIIHRDLKASNILLDENLCPKISDFGIARTFGGDQFEGSTSRVVGTSGYMAPEYAVDGLFSVKSDVFSFGILVLEIVCGKRNKGLYHTDMNHNLVGHAWTLWKSGKMLDLIDLNMKESLCVVQEVLRCLHVSLLCVQQYPEDRPTMMSVILMLESNMELVDPKEHGFISRNTLGEIDLRSNRKDTCSSTDVTMTLLEAR